MKRTYIKQVIFSLVVFVLLLGPALAYAQDPGSKDTNKSGQATGMAVQVRLKNPLKVDDIQSAIKLFFNAVLKIAMPIIIIFLIWSGFRFIFARGNPTEIGKAKQMFWWTVVGTLLVLGAWAITNAIIGTVNSVVS